MDFWDERRASFSSNQCSGTPLTFHCSMGVKWWFVLGMLVFTV